MSDSDTKVRHSDWRGWLETHASHRARSRDEYELHLAAHEWTLGSSLDINNRGDFQSLRHIDVEPFAHQVEDAILFFRRLAPRGLIADDVGLGKTVTAGLIAAELIERGRVESILIVCPKAILGQWQEELRTKFRIQAVAAVGQEFRNLSRHPHWVTTYATARSRMSLIKERRFDLLILDEAHALRNLYNNPPPQVALRFKELTRGEGARFVLMLSATPIQNRLWDIYSLLDIARAPQPNPLGSPQQFASTFVADHPQARRLRESARDDFRRRLGEATIRTRRADTSLLFPSREVRDERLTPLPEEARFVREALEAIVTLPPLVQLTHARTLMSSPWAAAAAFDRAANESRHSAAVRQEFSRLAAVGRGLVRSAKTDRVLEFARQLQMPGSPRRLIVFAMRVETLNHLAAVLSDGGFKEQVSIFRGGQEQLNRLAVEEFMAEPPLRPILLSTDAGAVGLNLQAGNVVINYDLPWNPMLIEQRIGRVQRLGQKAEKVVVYNLVLAGTIEDRIVLRLMEKLNLFHQAIGEMEELLEITGFDDEEGGTGRSIEDVIMELVRKAAQQIDVDAQLRQMEESRRQAELKLKEMREATDTALKSIRPSESEARLQDLPRIQPRLSLEAFVRAVLDQQCAEVREGGPGRFIARTGMNWTTFVTGRPSESGEPHAVHLAPGTRQFEDLTRRLRSEVSHHAVDGRGTGLDRLRHELSRHLGAAGLVVEDIVEVARSPQTACQGTLKASAKVSMDQYQTLAAVKIAEASHGVEDLLDAHLAGTTTTKALPLIDTLGPEWVARAGLLTEESRTAATHAEGVAKFCDFYAARRDEELARLRQHSTLPIDAIRRAEQAIQFRFTPEVSVEPVSIAGLAYDVVQGDVLVRGQLQRESFPLSFSGVPLTGVLTTSFEVEIAEPWVCPGRHIVARDEFLTCSAAECTRGSCARCADDVKALAVCGNCETRLCSEHREACVACGVALCRDHALVLDVGNGYACAACSDVLDDGRRILQKDQETSAVSGRRHHRDAMVQSDLSGQWALPDELIRCAESDRLLLPEETVVCAVTNLPVGVDLTAVSEVSSKRGVRSRMARSSVSGGFFVPGEGVRCEETGEPMLPTEVVVCVYTRRSVRPDLLEEDAATHARVLKRLLRTSDVSPRRTLPTHLVASDRTGRFGLPDEIRRCEVCGITVLVDEGRTCPETDRFGCSEHFEACEVTGRHVLPNGLGRCDVTGARVARSLLEACPDSGRTAQRRLFETCAHSGVAVLAEALDVCAVSGERVRKVLLGRCDESGRPALPDRLGTCFVTAKRILPDLLIVCAETGGRLLVSSAVRCDETGALCGPAHLDTCAATGKRVRRSLLGVDEVDGRSVLQTLLRRCEAGGRLTLAERLVTCSATGRRVQAEFTSRCAVSDRVLLSDHLQRCDVTHQLVHPDLLMTCPETGQRLLREAAVCCEASKEHVSPAALAACGATGQQVRRSLLVLDEVSRESVLATLLRACEQTGRRTLPEHLVRSSVSGREILRDISAQCSATGAWALPEELETCSVSGDRLLPALVTRCSESGQTVARKLLETCAASGRQARPEFLGACAGTGARVLNSLLRPSELSGALSRDEALVKCDATARRVLPQELMQVEVPPMRVCHDRVVQCHVCARSADIGHSAVCRVCDQRTCAKHHLAEVCDSCVALLERESGRQATAAEEARLGPILERFKIAQVVDSATRCHVLLRMGGFLHRRSERLLVFERRAGRLSTSEGAIVDRPLKADLRAELRVSEPTSGADADRVLT